MPITDAKKTVHWSAEKPLIKKFDVSQEDKRKNNLDLFVSMLKESFKGKAMFSIEGSQGVGIVLLDEIHIMAFKHTSEALKLQYHALDRNSFALLHDDIMFAVSSHKGKFDGFKKEFVEHYQSRLNSGS